MDIHNAWFRRFSERRVVKGEWPATVRRRNVFILPTRFGLLAAASLVVLLLIAVNYQNSSVFMLCFFMAAVGWTVMIAAHRQLTSLALHSISVPIAEQGSRPTIEVRLEDIAGRPRDGIVLSIASATSEPTTVSARTKQDIALTLAGLTRGRHLVEQVTLHNTYPFGLFHVWARIAHPVELFVYPKPARSATLPIASDTKNSEKSVASEPDDFLEFRRYRTGDRPAQIAWSVYAKTGRLEKKHFASDTKSPNWLDFNRLSNADEETRLAILAMWAIEFHRRQHAFGLRLPTYAVAPGSSLAHLELCLKALACYPGPYVPPFST